MTILFLIIMKVVDDDDDGWLARASELASKFLSNYFCLFVVTAGVDSLQTICKK